MFAFDKEIYIIKLLFVAYNLGWCRVKPLHWNHKIMVLAEYEVFALSQNINSEA